MKWFAPAPFADRAWVVNATKCREPGHDVPLGESESGELEQNLYGADVGRYFVCDFVGVEYLKSSIVRTGRA
jgi:hypothetical protein